MLRTRLLLPALVLVAAACPAQDFTTDPTSLRNAISNAQVPGSCNFANPGVTGGAALGTGGFLALDPLGPRPPSFSRGGPGTFSEIFRRGECPDPFDHPSKPPYFDDLPVSNDPSVGGEFTLNGANVSVLPIPIFGGIFTQVTMGSITVNGVALCPNGFFPTATCGPTTSQGVTVKIDINNNVISNFVLSSPNLSMTGIPTPIISGATPGAGQVFSTDPISTATGVLTSGPTVALSLGGPLPLTLRYLYSSGLGAAFGTTGLGVNWMTNFDPYLLITGSLATVNLEGGGTITFRSNGGAYQTLAPARFAYQFVKNATAYRFLNPQTNLIYSFDTNGHFVRIEDRNGNALTVTQSTPGPTQVSDGLGRTLTFSYTTSGKTAVLTKVTDQSGRSVSFTQDVNGNLTSVTDANGNKTTYSYTANAPLLTKATRPLGNTPYTQSFDPFFGTATAQADSGGNTTKFTYVSGGTPGKTVMTDPLGRTTTYNYADLTNISSLVDAAGQTASRTYDSLKRPVSATDRLGNKTSLTYDAASGYIATITDALGNTTTFTYQSQVQGDFTYYNLAKVTYADGTSVSYSYDASGNVLKVTDRAGKATTYTYNSRGQVLTRTNQAGGVTTYTYNSDGTLATVKLPSGDQTAFTYDGIKRLSKIQFADNTSVSLTRDAIGHVLSVTDERGKVRSSAYDANNNLQSLTDALSKTAKFTYDTDDLPSSAADRAGNTSKVQYDPLGSPTSVTNGAGEKTTFTYDKLERPAAVADPSGKAITYTYDAQGRLASLTNAIASTISIQTNKNGQPTQLTSPLGEGSAIAYDSLGRPTGITDALGRQTTLSYDSRGLPLSINSPGGITSSFAYGDLPLLASMTDPNGGVWTFSRDNLGRVTSATDPLGQARSYKYDARSRLSSVTSPIDSGTLTYDAAGNLTGLQFSDNTAYTYTFDDNNRMTGGTGFTLGYDANGRLTSSNGLAIARDAAGRITSITYAPGKTATYTYDSRGLLSAVSDWTNGSVKFTLNDAHQLTTLTRSNGVATAYTYDKDGRVTSITDSGGGKTLASVAVTRDAIGRVTSSNRTLPQEAAPASGNNSLAYDAANQISSATYDGRGRLTADNAGATYQWNSASRLKSYSRPDGSASFTYDGLNQRVSRTSSGSTTNYVLNYATSLPTVATTQSGGADQRYYVYTPAGALLFSVDAASGTHRFYSFDDAGSTTMLTDDTGTITDAYGISAYGDVVTARNGNATDNPFTWQGQFGVMQEAGSGLFYARFRYYDSGSARFLSRDPITSPAPRRIDPYQYAAGNPVGNGDPQGLKTTPLLFREGLLYQPVNLRGAALASFDAQVGSFESTAVDPLNPNRVFSGFEKTFLDGSASVTVTIPIIDTPANPPNFWDFRPGDDAFDTILPNSPNVGFNAAPVFVPVGVLPPITTPPLIFTVPIAMGEGTLGTGGFLPLTGPALFDTEAVATFNHRF